MLQQDFPPDAQRYAEEACALRALAERSKTLDVQHSLLRVATLYDMLAELVKSAALHTLTAAALVTTWNLPPKKGATGSASRRAHAAGLIES